jgi:non-ribosomal peptide synthetase component F
MKRTNNDVQQAISYWQQQLAGSSPLLPLLADKPRPSVVTHKIATQHIYLAKDLVESLKKIVQDRHGTLSTALLAVFKILIYRYSSQSDIVVGSQIAKYYEPDIKGVTTSYFDNVVFRTDLSDNPTFVEVLERVEKVVDAATLHQNLSFDRLIEVLNIDRSSSYHPLFQVLFSFQEDPADLATVAVTSFPLGLDLSLQLEQVQTEIGGYFEYSPDLFTAATISRMEMHFQALLAGVVANPDQHIDQLPLLSDSERQQLLIEWNQTKSDYSDQSIHQLFEVQVELTPTNIAVVFAGAQLTYQELNHQANQLAHYLQKLGVAPDVPVGIYLDRSISMMVGLMGILKAGGVYVPLDSNYPADRLNYMLEHSQVKVLVSNQSLIAKLPTVAAQVVCLDIDGDQIRLENTTNLDAEVRLDHLGYIIYTSGSTGLPKGVAMTQRALCNLLAWQINQPTAIEQATTLQFTPISFDVSFQEIFSTWCVGGTLVLVANEIRRDPFALLELLDRAAIERLFLPFVALQQLAEVAVSNNSFPQLLTEVITAGEQLQIF